MDAATRPARLASDRLRIRHVEPGDFDAVAVSMSTPRALAGTLQLPWSSREQWRKQLADYKPESALLVAETRGSVDEPWEIVATAGLQPTGPSPRRRHAMALGMAVRDDWQGRGVGSALMDALIDRADNWMNVLRLELTVYVDNEAAHSLYRRHGFVIEGTHRAYALRDGAYVDAHAMARLHPRPPVLPPAT